MFESLTLWNCQIHEKIKIEFDSLVTCIIGPTDEGKSTLIRFLDWVCTNNSPSKIDPKTKRDGFINWNATKCKAKLIVDGKKIIREKGDGVNKYSLDDKVFTAFGANVPDEIIDSLNLGEENFQFQHDPHFWFSKTPGQVSKELNRIVDLEAIDTSLAAVASMLRKAKSTVEVSEERLQEATKQKEDLEWIVEASEQWSKLEDRQSEIDRKRSLNNAKREIFTEVADLTEKQKVLSEIIYEMKNLVQRAEEITKKRQELSKKIDSLKNIEETKYKLSELKSRLDEAKKEFQKKTENQNCPICGNSMGSSRTTILEEDKNKRSSKIY